MRVLFRKFRAVFFDKRPRRSVSRHSTGTFYVLNSGRNTVNFIPFGRNGDVPVNGDFDEDGKTDIVFWRSSSGHYFVLRSSSARRSESLKSKESSRRQAICPAEISKN